jgi:hypothetical protein
MARDGTQPVRESNRVFTRFLNELLSFFGILFVNHQSVSLSYRLSHQSMASLVTCMTK